jgi:hypothetical protein
VSKLQSLVKEMVTNHESVVNKLKGGKGSDEVGRLQNQVQEMATNHESVIKLMKQQHATEITELGIKKD